MKSIMDYNKLQLVETQKVQTVVTIKTTPSYFKSQLSVMILLLILIFAPYPFSIGLGSFIVFWVLLFKCIKDSFNKSKFNFLPEPDKNYIEMPYKNKLEAIDAKVTCHPESNPVKIMMNSSNRVYSLSNNSNSFIGALK